MVKLKGKDQCFLRNMTSLPPVAQALLHTPTSFSVSGNGYMGKGGTMRPTLFPFYNVEEIVMSHLEIECGLRFLLVLAFDT